MVSCCRCCSEQHNHFHRQWDHHTIGTERFVGDSSGGEQHRILLHQQLHDTGSGFKWDEHSHSNAVEHQQSSGRCDDSRCGPKLDSHHTVEHKHNVAEHNDDDYLESRPKQQQ
mmetsp:Transcript_23631/g.59697  ORF Transcript_23631/g.59697 Transcript_23631/m.59697 type:complete len:113 (-) Transcript_23631:1131-1469(-)